MRRITTASIAVAVIAALAFLFVQLQPSGKARVFRNGSDVRVLDGRLGFAARFGSIPCLVPRSGDALFFQQPVHVTTKSSDELDVNVSFTYKAPPSVPAGWPEGDWCSSLTVEIQRLVSNATSSLTLEEAAQHPRQAGDAVLASLQAELERLGLAPHSVAARLVLPKGIEQVRSVPAVAGKSRRAHPVIFIGLDAADWELLDDYMARGLMPNLAALVREGASGPLFTEHPPLSPLLWTTMMTGVSPLEHQVLDFTRFNPTTGNKEPITSDERKVPAIWNMATQAGKRVAVFGLWATYPAEAVRGLDVSDRLFTFLYSEGSPPAGIVFPPGREAWARQALRDAEVAIDYRRMKHYLPWLTESDYSALASEANPYQKPGSALRRILVETEVYSRLSTSCLAGGIPDLTIVYFQGTDTIGHIFAPYAPPRQESIPQEEYDRYHDVPELYFRDIDDLLGRYRRIADVSQATLMIASDHGFYWKNDRPTKLSSFAAASAAKWHRNQGIWVVHGPGIAAVPKRSEAAAPPRNARAPRKPGIRQVCATLLALAGLPQGDRIAEPPLVASPMPGEGSVDYRQWFEPVAAIAAVTPTTGADDAIAKLRALGYIGTSESTGGRPASESAGATRTAGAYNNQGLILKHDGRIADAMASFDKALSIDPNLASAAWNLSDLLFEKRQQLDRADQLLVLALKNGLPEATKHVVERAIRYQRSGKAERSLHLLEGAVAVKSQDGELRMFRGRYRVEMKDCAGALDDFRAAQQISPDDPIAWASAGLAAVCLGNIEEARRNFRRSLELNPNQPILREYLRQ